MTPERRRNLFWLAVLIVALALLAFVVTGCGGISKQEWDGLKAKLKTAEENVAAIEDKRLKLADLVREQRARLIRLQKLLNEAAAYIEALRTSNGSVMGFSLALDFEPDVPQVSLPTAAFHTIWRR